jgi:hypothetical protein
MGANVRFPSLVTQKRTVGFRPVLVVNRPAAQRQSQTLLVVIQLHALCWRLRPSGF